MKRRQRAGLPLYPHEIQHLGIGNDDEFEIRCFQFPNQDHPNHQDMIQYTNSSNTSPSSSSFSSSSSQPPKELCLDPLISTNPGLNQIPNMFSPYNNSFENDNKQFGFSLTFSSSSSSNELCNPDQLLELMSENLDTNVASKKDIDVLSLMGDHETIPSYFSLGLDTTVLELPSNQTPCTSNIMHDNNVHLDSPAGNSGLLDALLEESRALSRGGIFKDARVSSSGLCEFQDKRVKMDFENRLIDHLSSSHQSSFESNSNLYEKHNEATMLKATVDDDDDDMLKSLLNSFPSTTPLPDWYQTREILIKGGLTERNIDRTPSR
ncbi:hypothetical protein BRARA_D01963 [Brassica rapa]|uniref:Uncharacterized protein n=1 Tax=Brassica campestris TaxID=3711 RepID=A0A397ZMG7_BRACM|nr:hypothetical protein BRARA_D01963 [Brassica rapa]